MHGPRVEREKLHARLLTVAEHPRRCNHTSRLTERRDAVHAGKGVFLYPFFSDPYSGQPEADLSGVGHPRPSHGGEVL